MLVFEESGNVFPSESSFECKKILERTDKERFLSTKHEVSDLDDVLEDDGAVGVHVVDETRATTRKKAAKQKRAFLPLFIGIIALCSKRETRERDEKGRGNSTLSEIAISLSFSPFSSRCGCFSLVQKND